MPESDEDPTASTARFQAFVEDEGPAQESPKKAGGAAVILMGVVGVLAIAVIVWLVL